MSLINQMLADLEARRGGSLPGTAEVFEGLHAAAGAGALGQRPARLASSTLAGLAVGTAVVVGAWSLGLQPWTWIAPGRAVVSGADHGQARADGPVPPGGPRDSSAAIPAASAPGTALAQASAGLLAYAFPSSDEALVLDEPQPEPRMSSTTATAPASPRASAPVAVVADTAATTVEQANVTAAAAATTLPSHAVGSIEHAGSLRREALPMAPEAAAFAALARRVAQADAATAESELGRFVAGHPDHLDARAALAAAALRAGDRAAARDALVEGLARAPREYRFALMLAHIEMEAGQLAAARDHLVGATPPAAQRGEHLAFVAALQQRLGDHTAAVAAYRGALEDDPARGAWWVGLGISLAAQREDHAAAEAFARALTDDELSSRLRTYVVRQAARLSSR